MFAGRATMLPTFWLSMVLSLYEEKVWMEEVLNVISQIVHDEFLINEEYYYSLKK